MVYCGRRGECPRNILPFFSARKCHSNLLCGLDALRLPRLDDDGDSVSGLGNRAYTGLLRAHALGIVSRRGGASRKPGLDASSPPSPVRRHRNDPRGSSVAGRCSDRRTSADYRGCGGLHTDRRRPRLVAGERRSWDPSVDTSQPPLQNLCSGFRPHRIRLGNANHLSFSCFSIPT